MPPGKVYLALRLAHARRLVEETTFPVADIAAAAGFESPSSFTRSFREQFHAAPRALRAGGRGLGTRLYTGLLDRLAATDVHRCYGVITVPNPESIRLHEKLGFVEVGRLTECGRKFDRWWDVVWMERGMEN
jgi:phosphinothricin acetyltransferase